MNTQNKSFSHILDTSSVVAYLANEKGADKIVQLRKKSAIPFIVMSELYYVIARRIGKAEADKIYGIVKSWNIPILVPNERVMINAGRIKSVYKLGIADSYITAIAKDEQAILVTKEKDYNLVKAEVEVMFI